jgi:phospholipid-translocating ATPase
MYPYSFFLTIAILQFFPKFSTISPGLVIFPLLVVLAFTGGKDAYEDTKRHQSDRKVNHSHVRVLAAEDWVNPNAMKSKGRTFVRGVQSIVGRSPISAAKSSEDGWRTALWEDVRVGDFVKIVDDEPLPADILICATSEDENVAFVETKNLDGETNLKSRHAVPNLVHLRDATACAAPENAFRVELDRPDNNMYRLNGVVLVGDEPAPVDLTMTLLRGTVLRNTRWVIGLVLFTGEDTKIVLNSGGTPSKRSKVERGMNPQVCVPCITASSRLSSAVGQRISSCWPSWPSGVASATRFWRKGITPRVHRGYMTTTPARTIPASTASSLGRLPSSRLSRSYSDGAVLICAFV